MLRAVHLEGERCVGGTPAGVYRGGHGPKLARGEFKQLPPEPAEILLVSCASVGRRRATLACPPPREQIQGAEVQGLVNPFGDLTLDPLLESSRIVGIATQ